MPAYVPHTACCATGAHHRSRAECSKAERWAALACLGSRASPGPLVHGWTRRTLTLTLTTICILNNPPAGGCHPGCTGSGCPGSPPPACHRCRACRNGGGPGQRDSVRLRWSEDSSRALPGELARTAAGLAGSPGRRELGSDRGILNQARQFGIRQGGLSQAGTACRAVHAPAQPNALCSTLRLHSPSHNATSGRSSRGISTLRAAAALPSCCGTHL